MSSPTGNWSLAGGAYPERVDPLPGWLDEAGERVTGLVLRRLRSRRHRAERIAKLAAEFEPAMQGEREVGLRRLAAELRVALRRNGFREEHVARCFALVREVADRGIGQRPYDVQLQGGSVLLDGMVAEMATGEGKTLTATLPAAAAALAGIPVHVVTVNDYLVGRDAESMGPIYRALGLSVGSVQHGMEMEARRRAYACDVTYVSNKEVAFDYLRDRLALGPGRSRLRLQLERLSRKETRGEGLLLRGLHFGIVDEADSVLIDEARTPLIISRERGTAVLEEQVCESALAIAEKLVAGGDFRVDPRERSIELSEAGKAGVAAAAEKLGGIWTGRARAEELVTQALTALYLFVRDKHYLVSDGKVQIIDEYTGRTMPDRSWELGLHQMLEAKEGCELTGEKESLARISYQRFFRRYLRLAGMTGTAREVAGELWSVYRLPVVPIPTNRPLRRSDEGEKIYATEEEKWQAVVERIFALRSERRPVLVGTRSVRASERLSDWLRHAGLEHEVLNARQDQREAEIIARAGEPGRITVATNLAGRGTDIRISEGTARLGGLHVLATERHEARRIDRQLFGRCGRQGDPGSYEAFASLEDDVCRAHAGSLVRWLAGRLGRSSFGPHAARLALEIAQRRAERLHSRGRRWLVRLDAEVERMLAFSGRGE